MSETPTQKAYTVQQAAATYGVSADVIRSHIKNGTLIAHYPSTRPVIGAKELDAWFEATPTEPNK